MEKICRNCRYWKSYAMIWDVEQEDDDYGVCTCSHAGRINTWFDDTCLEHKKRDEEEQHEQVVA